MWFKSLPRHPTNHRGQEATGEAQAVAEQIPRAPSRGKTRQPFRSLHRLLLAGGTWGSAPGHIPCIYHNQREGKGLLLLFLIPSPTPSKIFQQKDYPLTPTSSQPVGSWRPQLNQSRRAGEVSAQKSPFLAIKYHLHHTGPSGISCVSKGHGLMRMQTF